MEAANAFEREAASVLGRALSLTTLGKHRDGIASGGKCDNAAREHWLDASIE